MVLPGTTDKPYEFGKVPSGKSLQSQSSIRTRLTSISRSEYHEDLKEDLKAVRTYQPPSARGGMFTANMQHALFLWVWSSEEIQYLLQFIFSVEFQPCRVTSRPGFSCIGLFQLLFLPPVTEHECNSSVSLFEYRFCEALLVWARVDSCSKRSALNSRV